MPVARTIQQPVIPNETSELPVQTTMLTLHDGAPSGRTRKPGLSRMNWNGDIGLQSQKSTLLTILGFFAYRIVYYSRVTLVQVLCWKTLFKHFKLFFLWSEYHVDLGIKSPKGAEYFPWLLKENMSIDAPFKTAS